MSDDGHNHGAGALRAGARHQKRLLIAFVLISVYFVVEAAAGLLTNSLALLSDAGHMLTDVIGLGMALAAIQLATRHAQRNDAGQNTFGLYRLEILAAFVNALLLFGVAIYVLIEAARRITDTPEVLGVPMLIVATLGLVVNLIAFALLRQGATESLNVEGAYLEVLADAIGSVGVIIAAVLLPVLVTFVLVVLSWLPFTASLEVAETSPAATPVTTRSPSVPVMETSVRPVAAPTVIVPAPGAPPTCWTRPLVPLVRPATSSCRLSTSPSNAVIAPPTVT